MCMSRYRRNSEKQGVDTQCVKFGKPTAAVVLRVSPFAAVLERDVSVAGHVISLKRGSMGRGLAEVLFITRAQYQDIPNDIPLLSGAEARNAIPLGLREKSALVLLVFARSCPFLILTPLQSLLNYTRYPAATIHEFRPFWPLAAR